MNIVVSDRSGGEDRSDQSNVVWRRIRERIEERLAVVERGITTLLKGGLSAADAASCRAEAALLCDWLFALDLVVAGRLARDLAEHFDGAPHPESAATIATVVDRLRSVVRIAEHEWATVDAKEHRVHFVCGADAQIDAVAWHLQQSGIEVSMSPTFFSAPDNVDVLVVMTAHPSDALQLFATARERSPKMTRVLVHRNETGVNQLLPVSVAVDLLLPYNGAPIELANQILISLRPTLQVWNHALMFGANDLYSHLVQAGFQGLIADNPESLIHTIETGGSNVVVLGPEVPDRTGLVHLLRCTPATRRALIAVSYASSDELEALQRVGADLLIPESDVRGTWARQLRVLALAEDHASGVVTDESKPLPTGHRAWVSLERAINDVQRSGANAALVTIALPTLAKNGEEARLHHLLAEEFRQDDTVVILEPTQAAVVLVGAELDQAVARIERAIAALKLPARSGAAAIAPFPAAGLGVKALVESANSAAERAEGSEGPSVVAWDWFPGTKARLDVLIVESSPTLRRLLGQLLERDGYTIDSVGTGSGALKLLTGHDPLPAPRLILLELDAMGADGMMILRSLHRAGQFNQSRVIVTASLQNDGQLREAFELGVDDVVAKPFSTVVLRNRVGRALS